MRERLRLYSGLVLMVFVTTHLLNHIGGIVSLKSMDDWRPYLTGLWSNLPMSSVLAVAFVVHIGNAFYSVYIRSTLRMRAWEALQLGLGLAVPLLLAGHFTAAFIGQMRFDYQPTYQWVVTYFWIVKPGQGVLQGLGLAVAWIHGCIGIHYWLRLKPWYPEYRFYFAATAVAILSLAGSGYIASGLESLQLAQESPWIRESFATMGMPSSASTTVGGWLEYSFWVAGGGALFPFALRMLRVWHARLQSKPVAVTPNGVVCTIEKGTTLLEALRARNIPHAAVCGGRGRCTTCRVRILDGMESIPPPGELESKALERIAAPDGVRLACQILPVSDIKYVPLLPPDASASDGRRPGGLEGQEKPVTAMFVDLRESTKLGETKLPYDVLFILNQFFAEMTAALRETKGHYAQFAGDGLLALYGLNRTDPKDGIRDAVDGAIAMHRRLASLNQSLSSELAEPLRIGIGINHGDAIVGMMGPPDAQLLTAIGDSINTAARLENLSKEHDGATIVSKEAVETGGLTLPGLTVHTQELRGRRGHVEYYAVQDFGALENKTAP